MQKKSGKLPFVTSQDKPVIPGLIQTSKGTLVVYEYGAYKALSEYYYPPENPILSVFPNATRISP